MKPGQIIRTESPYTVPQETYFVKKTGDFVLFSQDLDEYPLWVAHKCEGLYVECWYLGYERYRTLTCFVCKKEAPKELTALLNLTKL